MEMKVVCDCGQKYAFDVEPVNGRMPAVVNCPACGADGTSAANSILSQVFPDAPPPMPVVTPAQPAVAPSAPPPALLSIAPPASPSGLRISRPAPATEATTSTEAAGAPPPLATVPRPIAPVKSVSQSKLEWYQYIWIGLPLVLIALGGAIGGACGGAACAINRTVFLKINNPVLKYVWTGLISAAAFVLWLVIAGMLVGLIHGLRNR